MKLGILTPIALTALLAAPASAGVITGRVVDMHGNGIAGVDIDVENEGSGGDPDLSQDFTDPNGFFTTTVTPNGVYNIFFKPPAPPTTTLLVREFKDFAVSGTVNMGNVVLSQGVLLQGRTISGPTGLPVGGVNLDVIDASGNSLTLVGDTSAANGTFGIAVPTGSIDVRFKTDGVIGQTLAPRELSLNITGGTNLGDVVLPQGYVLSALIRRSSNNTAVSNVDLDVINAVTGEGVFITGDNSDGSGFVDVVVASGLYDVEFCPPFSTLLVAKTLKDVSVTANTFLGTVFLEPGVVLSGMVSGQGAGAQANVDVDVRLSSTGSSVTLCGDNTAANGTYAVVVPLGTFDLSYTPPAGTPFCPVTIPSVLISGAKTQNAVLPLCGGVTNYCTAGTSASGCQAQLSSAGTPSASATSGFDVIASGVEGAKDGLYFYGFNGPQANSWGNGTSFQCVVPPVFRAGIMTGVGTNGGCNGSFSKDMNVFWAAANPSKQPAPGQNVRLQLWYRDPQNTSNQTTSLSDGLSISVQP